MNATTPHDSLAVSRKGTPVTTGVLDYFPLALAEIARLSKTGNDKHNPGEPLHWAKEKSTDHADCIVRHLMERGTLDTDGHPHSAHVAWRALAMLQIELEAAQAKILAGGLRKDMWGHFASVAGYTASSAPIEAEDEGLGVRLVQTPIVSAAIKASLSTIAASQKEGHAIKELQQARDAKNTLNGKAIATKTQEEWDGLRRKLLDMQIGGAGFCAIIMTHCLQDAGCILRLASPLLACMSSEARRRAHMLAAAAVWRSYVVSRGSPKWVDAHNIQTWDTLCRAAGDPSYIPKGEPE